MKQKIICVGKLKEKYLSDGCAEYIKRLSAYQKTEISELPEVRVYEENSISQINLAKEKEGENILSAIKDNDFVICLCIDGKSFDSVSFSKEIENILLKARGDIIFVIGGSYGLSHKVIKRADLKLSFSEFTFPHQLMRLILLEQIYRAYKIKNKEKYHK
ncbi:MAG: 23S rRNA (pseudouridine(1915)-N(3))-methyltransferase RlmH [Clostridia bacterium]|nr:23S rRNA (pseudouridine(1915)-N(3))-methyltransferase RlmH [Clostridia bacterium]